MEGQNDKLKYLVPMDNEHWKEEQVVLHESPYEAGWDTEIEQENYILITF